MLSPYTEHANVTRSRIPWLDNLRTCMVFLVVAIHAAGIYESSGKWSIFWIVDDPSTTPLSDLLIVLLDILLMPALFFVSGWVTPDSLKTRSAITFLKTKARRLLVPWLIAVLTLIPLYKFIFLYSRNISQEYWASYFHWRVLWGQNWLWFLPVLFLFNAVYLVAVKVRIMPTRVSLKGTTVAIFLVGLAYSCCMDLFGLRGWTHTLVLDFQNERLLIYFMMFVLGAICSRQQILTPHSRSKTFYVAFSATTCVIVTLYYLLYKRSTDSPGTNILSPFTDTLLLWTVFHAAMLSTLYLTLAMFRRFLNRHNSLSRTLSGNSYYVYIIHTIVLGGFATATLHTTDSCNIEIHNRYCCNLCNVSADYGRV